MENTHLGRLGSIVLAVLVITAVPVAATAAGQTVGDQNTRISDQEISYSAIGPLSSPSPAGAASGGTGSLMTSSSVSLNVSNESATPGESVTLEIELTNIGNSAASGGVIVSDIPSNWTIIGNTSAADTVLSNSVFYYSSIGSGETITPNITLHIPDSEDPYSIHYLTVNGTAGDVTKSERALVSVLSSSSSGTEGSISPDSPTQDGTTSTDSPDRGGDDGKDIYDYDLNGDYDGELDIEEVLDIIAAYNSGVVGIGDRTVLDAIALYNTGASLTYPDTDGDGLNDREEKVHGTPIEFANKDGDQFMDPMDGRPRTEDRPPVVNISSNDFSSGITIDAEDNRDLITLTIREAGGAILKEINPSGTAVEWTFSFDTTQSKY
jgi:uncharacterized repeat protein (TIGR01451 family)